MFVLRYQNCVTVIYFEGSLRGLTTSISEDFTRFRYTKVPTLAITIR